MSGACACGCGTSLVGLRADAVYASEACSKRARRAASPDKGRTQGPLQSVREQQATKKHNRDLGGLIRQAIIDRIKTTGERFADDLVGLYPEGEVKECRRLATAQFGGLVAAGLIREKERRKSSIPARKGAKSGVFEFTKAGWDRWGTAGVGGEGAPGTIGSGVTGNSPHSGDAGLTGPGSGVGVASPQGRPEANLPPDCADTASPDILPGGRGQARSARTEPADAASGEPLSLLPEPDPKAWAA